MQQHSAVKSIKESVDSELYSKCTLSGLMLAWKGEYISKGTGQLVDSCSLSVTIFSCESIRVFEIIGNVKCPCDALQKALLFQLLDNVVTSVMYSDWYNSFFILYFHLYPTTFKQLFILLLLHCYNWDISVFQSGVFILIHPPVSLCQ